MKRPRADQKLRIAIVVPGGVDRSGDRRVIPSLVALLSRLTARHDVHVFALHQERYPSEWELAGARIHNIGEDWTRLRATLAIVNEHRRAPFALIHSIFSGSCGLIAVAAAALLRIPSIVHVTGGELTALGSIGYGGGLRLRGRLREALVLRTASQVTAPSSPIVESVREIGIGAQRLPLGVDLRAWPRRKPQRRDTSQPARLLHVASLNRVKDQRTLLQAMVLLKARGQRFQLDVVGEDTLNSEIQTLANQLQLTGLITFHGFMTHREWRPLAEHADVLVMSSLHEAGPQVSIEAACVGVPTVGTAVGHIVEWSPRAALASPPGDPTQLAANIALLLDDEDLRMQLATSAHDLTLEYDIETTAERFAMIYERLLFGSSLIPNTAP